MMMKEDKKNLKKESKKEKEIELMKSLKTAFSMMMMIWMTKTQKRKVRRIVAKETNFVYL